MKRSLIFCWILLLVPSAVTCLHAQEKPKRPNILFILADDMGYGDPHTFNANSQIPTPHLDRLAASGARFTDAHSGGSVCVPSRYALMTGRFAVRGEMNPRKGPVIDQERMTVPAMLKANGYQTAMVGKWHLGFVRTDDDNAVMYDYSQPLTGGPADRGFDSFFGMHASLDIPPYFYIRDRQPTSPPTETIEAHDSVGGPQNWNNIQGAFWREGFIGSDFEMEQVTPRFTDETTKYLKNYADGERKKPFFCYLALPSPHTPWLPLEKYRGKSGAGMYGDFVMQVDDTVGQIISALEKTGLRDNTLVFFSSDNGPVWYDKDTERFDHSSTGGLRGMKFSSWEGGHRMPFIASWPGTIEPNTTCEQTIVFSDMFATLAELTGAEDLPESAGEDSVSFLPYLLDPKKPPSERPPIVHDGRTIRDGDWKLILPGGRRRNESSGELYNLKEDLFEQHNLYQKQPERVQRMKDRLNAIMKS
ncbi:MAG: arylsulfatase [Planctomycetaceae bacterium]|nr:arylsulfatase [Planctomycetaceae bacterium]